MASRAVHIELARYLSADSFLNVLRRFRCRRGEILSIISDNGTKLTAGSREVRESVEWINSKVCGYVRQKAIEWHFNSPTASHISGVFEREISTIRKYYRDY